jgi:DNA-3-methyladenine glycosylase I
LYKRDSRSGRITYRTNTEIAIAAPTADPPIRRSSYPPCPTAPSPPATPWHGPYHDREYGFPIRNDRLLFERLILEVNQAGLSWLTILKKRAAFRRGYDNFDLETVAGYGARDRRRLLGDAGIIRNRLKIDAAIANAQRILELRDSYGSFHGWLREHHPLPKADWVKLFKQTFRFTGGEIVGEFLLSTGFLPGAHEPGCPVYAKVLARKPAWLSVRQSLTPLEGLHLDLLPPLAAPAPGSRLRPLP